MPSPTMDPSRVRARYCGKCGDAMACVWVVVHLVNGFVPWGRTDGFECRCGHRTEVDSGGRVAGGLVIGLCMILAFWKTRDWNARILDIIVHWATGLVGLAVLLYVAVQMFVRARSPEFPRSDE